MSSYLLLILTFTLLASSTVLSVPHNFEERLDNLSEKLDQIELLLNSSVDKIVNKIDENFNDVKNILESHISEIHNVHESAKNHSISALLIIDVQNDFIDGSLSLRNCPSKHDGAEVVPVINKLLDTIRFDVVVYSYDWHPKNHISFFDNLSSRANLLAKDSTPLKNLTLLSTAIFDIPNIGRVEQTLWPEHCVQNSSGAALHRDLKVMQELNPQNTTVFNIYKGTKSNIDSYSAFWDNAKLSETGLHKRLQEKKVNQVFVVGLATDWCVYSTAIHAMEYGYQTFIVEDACRGVDEKTIKERLDDFKKRDGHVVQSTEIKNYLG